MEKFRAKNCPNAVTISNKAIGTDPLKEHFMLLMDELLKLQNNPGKSHERLV